MNGSVLVYSIMSVQMLLNCSKRLTDEACLSLYNYTNLLQRECRKRCLALYDKSSSGSSQVASEGVLEAHGNVTITNDGKTAKNHDAGTVTSVNIGISEGKLMWEFRLDHDDEESQCTCFGLAIKPIESTTYDSSPQLWMWRAFK